MTDHLVTAWNIRLCRPMTVDDAVELKETDPFGKTGDYWCHKDCYNSNPRRGIGVFPSRSHSRTYQDGVTVNVRGCFKHRQHSSNVCGVREKSRRKGEDSDKSRMFFTQFAGDLRDYLNGDIQFTSELNQYEVREFFEIESISEPRPENEPDFTIQHSGVNPEREETHIVIINQNRSRIRFFQEGRFHQLNTIIIRVTNWQQAEIEDFNGYGARSFHDAWNQLLGRITMAREEREKEEERLAEDYSKLLSKHLGISTEGMTNKEIIDLFGLKSIEIEKIVDKIRKDEEKRLADIADKEKEDELARKRAEKGKERKRRKQLKDRRSLFRRWQLLLQRWRGVSKRDTLKSSLKLFDQEHEILDESRRQEIELLDDLMDQKVVYDDWVEGGAEWGKKRISKGNDVISRVPASLAIHEEELTTMIENFKDSLEYVKQELPKINEKARREKLEQQENERDRNYGEYGIRETDNERVRRIWIDDQRKEHERRRQEAALGIINRRIQTLEGYATRFKGRLETLEMIDILRSKNQYLKDRPESESRYRHRIGKLREEFSIIIVKCDDTIGKLKIAQEDTAPSILNGKIKDLDEKWEKFINLRNGMSQGEIKNYLPDNGYGFIKETEEDREDIFFHVSNVYGIEPHHIEQGTSVIFNKREANRVRKGPSANWVIRNY